jgi:AcrR family transcriptional regulator
VSDDVQAAPPRPRTPAAERILDTASTLFYERGIRGVGVDAIAEQSGVTKVTLYKQFGSKDRLVAEYLRARDRRWRASLQVLTDRHVAPRDRLLAVFDAYAEWLTGDSFRGCAFVNAAVELADPEHPALEVARAHKLALRRHLVDLATEAGSHRPQEVAHELLLLLDGAAVAALMSRTIAPLDAARAAARRLLDAPADDAAPGETSTP